MKRGSGLLLLILFILPIDIIHAEEVEINFYDENGQLIVTNHTDEGEDIEIPTISKGGYNFYVFNTEKDGSGEYIKTFKALESENYYAIYVPILYPVNYYVNNELIYSIEIPYGEITPHMDAPYIKDMLFEYWQGIDIVVGPMNIIAVYKEDKVEKKVEMDLTRKTDKSRNVDRIDAKAKDAEEYSVNLEEVKVLQEEHSEETTNWLLLIAVYILTFLATILVFYFKKRKTKNA